ncbi:MAG: hypothetical protein ACQEXJ_24755 [Myxococcota bacterium]
MRPILLTGFGPFRDVEDNPSGWLARRLDGSMLAGRPVVGVELAVSYEEVRRRIPALVSELRPVLAVSTGVGRPGAMRLERKARNAVRSREADVLGRTPVGEAVVPTGPPLRSCRWDAEALAGALSAPDLAVETSEDAGGYVCDAAFYVLVHHLPPDVPGGFLHLPPTPAPGAREHLVPVVSALACLALGDAPTGGSPKA